MSSANAADARSLPVRFRTDVLCVGVLLVVVVLMWVPRLGGPIDLRFDGGVYWITGTSLARGDGYRLLNEPGEVRSMQYPPGLPLIVAAHQWAMGSHDLLTVGPALRITYALMSVALTMSVYVLARGHLRPAWAAMAALIAAFYPFSYYLSDVLYTEVPYALLAIWLAILLRRGTEAGRGWGPEVAGGVMVAGAFLLRTAGVALMAAWVGEAMFRRRWRVMAVRAAVCLVPFVAWQGYVWSVTSSAEYATPAYDYQRAPWYYSNVPYAVNSRLVDPFEPELGVADAGDLVVRVGGNLLVAPEAMGQAAALPRDYWEWAYFLLQPRLGLPDLTALSPAITFTLGALVLAGLVLMLRRRAWFFALFVIASTGIVCLTPWPEQFVRYLAPATPFLSTLLVLTLVTCADVMRRRFGRLGGTRFSPFHALVAFILLGIMASQLATVAATYRHYRQEVTYYDEQGAPHRHRQFYYDRKWRALHAAQDWVATQARPGDVMATSTPHTAYAHTGVKSVILPLEIDRERALALLDSVPVRFVVLDDVGYPEISSRYGAPAVEARPDRWRLVHEEAWGNARVYERVR